jgi:hypothetical protein
MGQRLELQARLVEILGSPNVYFQPPPTVQMKYPAIVYKRDNTVTQFADDAPYALKKRYLVTVIAEDPDSAIHEAIMQMPLCVYDRFYTADNLNHDVFRLFF